MLSSTFSHKRFDLVKLISEKYNNLLEEEQKLIIQNIDNLTQFELLTKFCFAHNNKSIETETIQTMVNNLWNYVTLTGNTNFLNDLDNYYTIVGYARDQIINHTPTEEEILNIDNENLTTEDTSFLGENTNQKIDENNNN